MTANPPIHLSRRQLIHASIGGLAATTACNDTTTGTSDPSLTRAPESTSPASPTNPADVIVVGAGVAGLAAARELQRGGKSVVIVEARDRIGGRLHTDRSLGVPFDLGASWIHGIDGNPITELASQAQAPHRELDFSNVAVYTEGGTRISNDEFAATESEFESLLERVVDEAKPRESVAAALERIAPQWLTDPLRGFFISTYLTFDTGELDRLSANRYDEGEEFEGPEEVMTEGYDKIATFLAAGLDIRLNQPVRRITAANGQVTVSTDGSEYTAERVIITAPLGVLKSGAMVFDPPLPNATTTAIEAVGFNAVNKFLFVWESTFWDDVDFLVYAPQRRDVFNWYANVNHLHPNSNALMTFAYGAEARNSETATDAQMTELVLTHLRAMYGGSVPAPTAMLRSTWANDPYAQGAYSFTATTTDMSHFDTLAEPVGLFHFAGEHTHRDYFSTVHGAYLSGLRAAGEILG